MEECTIAHIPPRLLTAKREPSQIFEVGEKLFRRSTKEELENPFARISLYDISHNREGVKGAVLSEPADVLYCFDPLLPQIKYELEICILEIVTLNPEFRYCKIFTDPLKESITAMVQLFHDPVACMYPHSVFQIPFSTWVKISILSN
jgi:hypothetical protein